MFWIPYTKYQCVDWLYQWYHGQYPRTKLRNKTKKMLQGWIKDIRIKLGR